MKAARPSGPNAWATSQGIAPCPHCGEYGYGSAPGDKLWRCHGCGRPRDDCNKRNGVGPLPLLVILPLRTKNPLNGGMGTTKQAAIIKSRRRHAERGVTRLAVTAALRQRGNSLADWLPARVTLTRVSVAKMDTDGLAASNKGIRDGIADALGCGDAPSSPISWQYAQRKGKRGTFAVEVLLERAPR